MMELLGDGRTNKMYSNIEELSGQENLERLGSIILSCLKLNKHWNTQDLETLTDYINSSRLPGYMKRQILDEVFKHIEHNRGKHNEN